MALVAAVIPDLLFGSKVKAALEAAGHEVRMVPGGDAPDADLLVVDLMADGVDPSALAAGGAPTLGFFAHTEPAVRERALAAGFDQVVPRSRMAREGPELVERLVAHRG